VKWGVKVFGEDLNMSHRRQDKVQTSGDRGETTNCISRVRSVGCFGSFFTKVASHSVYTNDYSFFSLSYNHHHLPSSIFTNPSTYIDFDRRRESLFICISRFPLAFKRFSRDDSWQMNNANKIETNYYTAMNDEHTK
jgi:hypothetical protein